MNTSFIVRTVALVLLAGTIPGLVLLLLGLHDGSGEHNGYFSAKLVVYLVFDGFLVYLIFRSTEEREVPLRASRVLVRCVSAAFGAFVGAIAGAFIDLVDSDGIDLADPSSLVLHLAAGAVTGALLGALAPRLMLLAGEWITRFTG